MRKFQVAKAILAIVSMITIIFVTISSISSFLYVADDLDDNSDPRLYKDIYN